MRDRQLFSHREAERILHKAGYSREAIKALLRDVPDPIDTERDNQAFFRHGVSLGNLMDRMGSSP